MPPKNSSLLLEPCCSESCRVRQCRIVQTPQDTYTHTHLDVQAYGWTWPLDAVRTQSEQDIRGCCQLTWQTACSALLL
jgi:hypothetical protein